MLTDERLAELGRLLELNHGRPVVIGGGSSEHLTTIYDLLGAVPELVAEVRRLQSAIRKHRDQRGDDRCWMDDEELYRALPEGFTPPPRDSRVELANCEKFIACRHNPGTEYVSPEREIERLRAELDRVAPYLAARGVLGYSLGAVSPTGEAEQ